MNYFKKITDSKKEPIVPMAQPHFIMHKKMMGQKWERNISIFEFNI